MTALARFYMQAAQKVIARAQDARPLDGSGIQPFGSFESYRPMHGFSKMEAAPEGPGLNSLEAGGLVR
jgi:hypothetical protein